MPTKTAVSTKKSSPTKTRKAATKSVSPGKPLAPGKPPASGKPLAPGKGLTPRATQAVVLDVVRALRENPKKYQAVRKAVTGAATDEARVQQLIRFATNDREVAALVPAQIRGTQALAWTTITITTIFIPATAR